MPGEARDGLCANQCRIRDALEELGLTEEELFDNVDLLRNVLLYHVSDPGQLTEPLLVQDIANGAEVPNLLGFTLQGGVDNIQEDVSTRDGGSIVISTRSVPSISGDVNDAKIVAAANVPAFNGVIHLINNVLIPPPVFEEEDVELVDEPLEDDATPDELSLFDVISDDERLSILSQALSVPAADSLRLALEEVTPDFEATIFAPTDDAFASLASALGVELEEILAAPFLLETLLYHATLGRVTSDAFSEEELSIDSVLGPQIVAQIVDGTAFLNGGVEVLEADISTLNGVLHIIDSVLDPNANLAPAEEAPEQDV